MIPTTEPAQRIAIMFKRRLNTHWNEREVKRYKTLVKDGYLIKGPEGHLGTAKAREARVGDNGAHKLRANDD